MKITARVALELASHEGLVRQAYKDSVGVWTWSIGITSASGQPSSSSLRKSRPSLGRWRNPTPTTHKKRGPQGCIVGTDTAGLSAATRWREATAQG